MPNVLNYSRAFSLFNRIELFTLDGGFVFTFGGYGREQDSMYNPIDITKLPGDKIVIVDQKNDRIRKISNVP